MNDKPVVITGTQEESNDDCACADKTFTVVFVTTEEGAKALEAAKSGPWGHHSNKTVLKKAGSKGVPQ